eukprot:7348286-Prymnesium_polylepis.1
MGTGSDVVRDLAHETLEGQLPDQKLSALLVLANLLECDGARAEAALLPDPPRGLQLPAVGAHRCLGGGQVLSADRLPSSNRT